MALVEYYIGNSGPFFMDDADPLYAEPTQVALRQDVEAVIIVSSDTVESETTFGQTAAAGVSGAFARGDHTHGTPANPVSGVTSDITVVTDIGPPQVTSVLHFTNGLLTSVT